MGGDDEGGEMVGDGWVGGRCVDGIDGYGQSVLSSEAGRSYSPAMVKGRCVTRDLVVLFIDSH